MTRIDAIRRLMDAAFIAGISSAETATILAALSIPVAEYDAAMALEGLPTDELLLRAITHIMKDVRATS